MLGVTWGPDQASHCHSDRFTAPGRDLRGAEEEVLRLRLATCITIVIQVARLRWPSTDWFSATWLPHRKPSCIIDFWCGAGKADAQTFACLLELAGQESRCSMWPTLNFSPFQWRPFFFLLLPPLSSCRGWGHLKHPLMLSVRPPAGQPGYKCSLPLHFSEAIIEWRLRQGRQWMDSLVPPPWGWSSSE